MVNETTEEIFPGRFLLLEILTYAPARPSDQEMRIIRLVRTGTSRPDATLLTAMGSAFSRLPAYHAYYDPAFFKLTSAMIERLQHNLHLENQK